MVPSTLLGLQGSTEMVLRYLDSKILPGYAAVNRGGCWGYAFFVYEAARRDWRFVRANGTDAAAARILKRGF